MHIGITDTYVVVEIDIKPVLILFKLNIATYNYNPLAKIIV